MARQKHRIARGLGTLTLVIGTSAALATGPVFAAGPDSGPSSGTGPRPGPGSAAAPAPAPEPAPAPAFGAFLDSGQSGVQRITQLSRWLGGTKLRVGHTYLPGDRWSSIEGDVGFLDSWARWRGKREDRIFVLNVPMLEHNEDHVGDDEVRALLRRGADGEFDQHFRALAERLVGLGVSDTVIVPGWEMNGTTYTDRCAPDPAAWKQYWKRIVTTMRAVPGQEFRFDFAPSRGRDAIPWTECYPGDDTVDIIGMDSYDQPQGESFHEQVTEPYGLQKQVDFAAAHGKEISYPEWGLFRNGDNQEYMRGMLRWMAEHKPVYNTITDYCPHGVWQCDANPRAAEVYREALSDRPEPTPEPSDTAPAPEPGDATPVPEPSDTTPVPEPSDTTPVPEPSDTAPVPEPEVTAPEPDVTVPEPEVTVPEPEATASEPAVTIPEPEPSGTTPVPEPSDSAPVPVPVPEPEATAPVPRPTEPPPSVTTPPVAPPTAVPVRPHAKTPRCVPLHLGDWIEHWFGKKLCVRFDWWHGRG